MHRLDLKSWSQLFAEDSDDTTEGIKKQIDRENTLKRGILKSIIKWRRIVEEMEGSYAGSNRTENEYRLRYYYQHQYNELLQEEMENLKTQRKTASTDNKVVFKDFTSDSSIPELRTKVRELKREKCVLNSALTMYERQLDKESMEFHKTREMCDVILNDVVLQQKNRLEHQEKIDKEFFLRIRRNFHNMIYGNDKTFSTSCLGLAKSRSTISSSQLVAMPSKTQHSKTSKPNLHTNSKLSIKSGVKGNRRSAANNRTGSARKPDSLSGVPDRSSPKGEADNKTASDPGNVKFSRLKKLKKTLNALKVLPAIHSSGKQNGNPDTRERVDLKSTENVKECIEEHEGNPDAAKQRASALESLPSKKGKSTRPPIPADKASSTESGSPHSTKPRPPQRKKSARKPKPIHLPSSKGHKSAMKKQVNRKLTEDNQQLDDT